MKISINHSVTITISAVGESEFGPGLLQKIEEKAKHLGMRRWYAKEVEMVALTPKQVTVTFHSVPLEKAHELRTDFKNSVVMLIEHGPDSDLLDNLLNRYPDLKTHPKLKDVVSAFENLTTVLKGVMDDKSNATLAEISRRALDGVSVVDDGDLVAHSTVKKAMDVDERAAFRDKAILGQTPEQLEAKPVEPDKPVVPPIYNKVLKQQGNKARRDPEAAGDHGNVFG